MAQKPLIPQPDRQRLPMEIEELDDSNNILSRYIKSSSDIQSVSHEKNGLERVDVQVVARVTSYYKLLVDAFLPVGFPDSVTEDYLEYQIYDSLQAFSSSIAGMLSSRAVLEGIGVGSTHTTPTAALLLSILQSSLGRLVTIAFASQFSSSLEPECKAYRFLADIFNDLAILLDCISPALPTSARITALCGASVLRALCGVAAGSAKASLSAHFAKRGNVGELAAKDSSQETVISLLGMLVGSLIVPYITTTTTTWSSLLLLISIHLYTNYRAVRAVCLPSLNCQRANLVFSSILTTTFELPSSSKPLPKTSRQSTNFKIPTPREIFKQERIFEFPSTLRFQGDKVLGTCHLGVSLSSILRILPGSTRNAKTGAFFTSHDEISALVEMYKDVEYILWYSPALKQVLVVFKENEGSDGGGNGSREKVYLKAWFHALIVSWSWQKRVERSREIKSGREDEGEDIRRRRLWEILSDSVWFVKIEWRNVERKLGEAGWDCDVSAVLVSGKGKVRIKNS